MAALMTFWRLVIVAVDLSLLLFCCLIDKAKGFQPVLTETTSSRSSRLAASTNPWTVNDADILRRKYHPKHVPQDIEYIIIGSGIGGLWLSACLAKFNITTLVLEQHYIAGGFQHMFRRGPYEFVPGLHYIANLPLCGPLYDMVATPTDPPLKYHQSGNAVPADQGALCSHVLQVGDLPLMQVKQGMENVRTELYRVFPEEKKAIDSVLKIIEQAKVSVSTGDFVPDDQYQAELISCIHVCVCVCEPNQVASGCLCQF